MTLDPDKILRYVPPERREETWTLIQAHYADVVTTNHPVVEDAPDEGGHRVLRFKRDPMTRWIVDVAMPAAGRAGDLNAFWGAALNRYGGKWSLRKLKQFYRDMGYSLCGFSEIFDGSKVL